MDIQKKLLTVLPNSEENRDILKIDMHVHSQYSNDSIIPIETLVRTWRKHGIISLVCDHDTLEGSKRVMRAIRGLNPEIPEILAEEITTTGGEIIGVFLTEEIPAGLSSEETIDTIHDQGGLSIVPHPFCRYRSRALVRSILDELIPRINIIEGYNSRNVVDADNLVAVSYANEKGKPISAGSDAHTPLELSRVWLDIPVFETPVGLLSNLARASIHFKQSPPGVHLFTKMVKLKKKKHH